MNLLFKKVICIGIILLYIPLFPVAIAQNSVEKQDTTITKKKKPFAPSAAGFNLRVSSTLDKSGIIGAGIHFNRSFFQFGVDFSLGGNFAAKSGLPDTWTGMDKLITDEFLLNEEVRSSVKDPLNPKDEHVFQEFIFPLGTLTFVPGFNFKYLSLECALGVSFNDRATLEYRECYNNSTGELLSIQYYSGTNVFKTYFLARPTAVLYIPFHRNHHGLSLSAGYNFVIGAEQVLNGWHFGIGGFWSIK